MSDSVAEIASLFKRDEASQWVSFLWDKLDTQRASKKEEWLELRNYVFATDTSTTSNSSLPWKNSTTIPKLCQIRDNLHSNYLSSLFPNDSWLDWVAYSDEAASKQKADTIKAYMSNKCREGHFRTEMSKLLYDYIDYGNSFATVSYESNYKTLADGEEVPGFIGPRVKRISPLDIVFDPTAEDITRSYKIVRSVKTIGELKKLSKTEPDQSYWEEVIARREHFKGVLGRYSIEDFYKATGFSIDGFGNLYEYYQSDFVEVLEFFGDYHDHETGTLMEDRVITVVDRTFMARNEKTPSWMAGGSIFHVGWRFRQDNLWAMGPLDNLVGMQYRIDHLENLKADAMDLCVHPPLLIAGEVEEFEWGPGTEIHLDENGSVGELGKSLNSIITAENQVQILEDKMEQMAGAPREAMGIRTPGEKTATEVQSLQNAAGRIFQEKITNFEIELLENILNAMLEISARSMKGSDIIGVVDQSIGVTDFQSITKSDITSYGKIRPIGARHFAKQAQDLQNIIGIFSSPIGQMIAPHTSSVALSKFVNDVTDLTAYNIFQENIAVTEQKETASLAAQGQEDLEAEAGTMPE